MRPVGGRGCGAIGVGVALAALSTGCAADGDGPAKPGVVHLSAWTVGPDQPSYTRKTNLIEGARRVNAELAAAGDPTRIEIDVDFATTSHEAYAKKLVFAFASDHAPDILCGGHELVGQFAPTGALVDLDPLLAADPAFTADIFPVLWEAMSHDGRVYGVPQDNEVRLIYYRTDLLRRLGWSAADIAALPDWVSRGDFTLDDLVALGEAAVARGVVEPDRAFYHRNRAGFDWLAYLLAYGGRLSDPATGRLVLSRGAALSTLRLFDRLTAEGLTPDGMMSYPDRSIYGGFTEGSVLSYLTGGSWNKLEWQTGFALDDARFRAEVGFAPLPGGRPTADGGKATPVSVSHPFACTINAHAADVGLAFRVIQRALDPDLDVGHAIGSSHLVVRQSSSRSPAYRDDPFLQQMIGYLRFTHFAPNHVKLTRFSRILYDAIRGVEVGMLDPDEALGFIEDACRARLGDDLVIED